MPEHCTRAQKYPAAPTHVCTPLVRTPRQVHTGAHTPPVCTPRPCTQVHTPPAQRPCGTPATQEVDEAETPPVLISAK